MIWWKYGYGWKELYIFHCGNDRKYALRNELERLTPITPTRKKAESLRKKAAELDRRRRPRPRPDRLPQITAADDAEFKRLGEVMEQLQFRQFERLIDEWQDVYNSPNGLRHLADEMDAHLDERRCGSSRRKVTKARLYRYRYRSPQPLSSSQPRQWRNKRRDKSALSRTGEDPSPRRQQRMRSRRRAVQSGGEGDGRAARNGAGVMKRPLGNDYCGFSAHKMEKLEPVFDGSTIVGYVRPTADGAGAYLAFDAEGFMVGSRCASKAVAVRVVHENELWRIARGGR